MELCTECNGEGKVKCPHCDGSGRKNENHEEKCECEGEKIVCLSCGGTGVKE